MAPGLLQSHEQRGSLHGEGWVSSYGVDFLCIIITNEEVTANLDMLSRKKQSLHSFQRNKTPGANLDGQVLYRVYTCNAIS